MIKPSRKAKPRQSSVLEQTLYLHLKAAKLLEGMEQEYRFAAVATGGFGPGVRQRIKDAELKDWRIDMAWVDKKLAVEVEGGTWSGGRHVRGLGFEEDARKYNVLVLLGWRVLRFTSTAIMSGVALKTIEVALQQNWSQSWVIHA